MLTAGTDLCASLAKFREINPQAIRLSAVKTTWEDNRRDCNSSSGGGDLSCFGPNISDVRLINQKGMLFSSIRSDNRNEQLVRRKASEIFLVAKSYAEGGGETGDFSVVGGAFAFSPAPRRGLATTPPAVRASSISGGRADRGDQVVSLRDVLREPTRFFPGSPGEKGFYQEAQRKMGSFLEGEDEEVFIRYQSVFVNMESQEEQ